MAKYQIYSNQIATNNNWVKLIPIDWKIVPLKYMCQGFVKDGPHETPEFIDEGVPFLSVDSIQNNKLIFDGCRYVSIEDDARFSLKCKPQKGDILLGKAASVGKVAFVESDKDFNVWSPLAVIRPKDIKLGKFIYYCLQSYELQLQCDVFSNSNTQKNLGMTTIDNLSFPYPSIEEAEKISEFLDHETAKIDSLISKQEKLIELLKEKRQAVISHAVTKGLNPAVTMKDSGVEWLGQVPEHWTVSKLKHFVNIVDCKHITAEFFDEGIPLASIGEVKGWNVNLSNAKLTNEKYYKELIDGNRKPQVGDIIYTRNATVGEASLVDSDLPKFALGQDVCLIHIIQKLSSEFLLHFLKSEIIKIQLNSAMVGSTFKRINVEDIRNYVIVIPSIQEQESILKDLNKKIEKYDSMIDFAVKQIQLMKERRTALISAAVTGKIDVRNWQNPTKAKMEFSA